MTARVAVVEDDPAQAELLTEFLHAEGYDAIAYPGAAAALSALENDAAPVDVVLTDVSMEGMDGLALCRVLKESRPEIPVIVITGESRLETAIAALRSGAYDFLPKPVGAELLIPCVRRAAERRRLTTELSRHGRLLASVAPDEVQLFGESEGMRAVREMVVRVAPSGASVLVQGETGTGKELVARALHAVSPRADGPFVAINCAALPASLVESELFGYAKGAFTDARAARTGLFVEATGGTLFLDEVGELGIDNQAKLLRVLQEHKVRPLGSNAELAFDARVVCASHRDLEAEVQAGRFREDLFYRLNVIRIALPPLRDRGMDIVHLANRFLTRVCERDRRGALTLGPEAAERMLGYAWPGNVRELENCIERMATLSRSSTLGVADLPEKIRAARGGPPQPAIGEPSQILPLEEFEKRYILRVLEVLNDNRSRAAEVLQMDRRTLYRRLEAWGLTGPRPTHSAAA